MMAEEKSHSRFLFAPSLRSGMEIDMLENRKVGFIGLGNMASAMIGGMLRQKLAEPGNILGNAKTTRDKKTGRGSLGDPDPCG